MHHPYSRSCRSRSAIVAVLLLVWTASSACAQNYSFDARRIALGGAGGTPNLASKMVERQRRYRSIVIPVGLVKLLSDVRVFFPTRDDFDFSRAVEYAYSPLHQVFGRREDMTAKSFFRDIVRAQLEPDLNAYRGFNIDPSINRRRSCPGELGQDVHAALGRPELSGDLRRRGSVSRLTRVCGIR